MGIQFGPVDGFSLAHLGVGIDFGTSGGGWWRHGKARTFRKRGATWGIGQEFDGNYVSEHKYTLAYYSLLVYYSTFYSHGVGKKCENVI